MKALALLCALLAGLSPVSAAVVETVALPPAPALPFAQAAPLSALKVSAAMPAPAAAALPQASPRAAALPALPALAAAAGPEASHAPAAVAAAVFDGGKPRASAASPVQAGPAAAPSPSSLAPSSAGAPRSPSGPPTPPRRSWLRRLNEATRPPSRAEAWLERGLVFGAIAAAAAPVAWGAYPFHWLMVALPSALALPVLAFGGLTLFRLGRFLAGRAPAATRAPPRSFRARAAVAGLALGLSLGMAPTIRHAELVQAVNAVVAPQDHAVRVPGGAIHDAVLADLSKNPVGRQVLDGLRDRGGVVRLPPFLVGKETDALAAYSPPYDAVFIGVDELPGYAPSVEAFLADPAAQARYVHENQGIFAHELEHAVQARRSPLEPGQFSTAIEYEWEAYLTEHFYTHARLLADPTASGPGLELGAYESALDDLDGYLKEIAADTAYKKDVRIDSPRYRAWLQKLHEDWPAHRAEAYRLLARRYASKPKLAERYLKAADAALKK